jgi:cytidylate kinase
LKKITITIDGASSTGKSTLAKRIADHMGYTYIDSGAMYRALTLYAIRNQLIGEDYFHKNQLIKELPEIVIDFDSNDSITLNGMLVEDDVRSMEVADHVSTIAKEPVFRKYLVAKQRELGVDGGVVMDGRDIGSVVFPDAEVKFYLVATAETRAVRRFRELRDKGEQVSPKAVFQNLAKRDAIDSTRRDSPLIKPIDSIELNSENASEDYLLQIALGHIQTKIN